MYIQVKNAIKEYGEGNTSVKALDNLSLSMEKGKLYVVLGQSGSGKTTFMNMIGGLDRLNAGEVIVDGKNITNLSKKELLNYRRECTGFVFQSYNLMNNLTVRENIQVVADISKEPLDVEEIMEALGIDKLSGRFPKELSGGQQQRVAIARAIVKKPKILLCDEPTGALDSKTSKAVLKQLELINQKYGITILIITHNEQITSIADGIIKIHDGKVQSFEENQNKLRADELEL